LTLPNLAVVAVAGEASGAVGAATTYGDQLTLLGADNEAWFDIVPTTQVTSGKVRYGHMYQGASMSAGRNVCITLQQDADGGTVYLNCNANTTGASSWLTIDCGATGYTVSNANSYRISIQTNSAGILVGKSGTYGSESIRKDTSFTYSCGAAVTNDAEEQLYRLMVFFDNNATVP
jgi:hypothetical protein